VVLHGWAGNGLELGVKVRHRGFRRILSKNARCGHLPATIAVWGGIPERHAHRGRRAEDNKRSKRIFQI